MLLLWCHSGAQIKAPAFTPRPQQPQTSLSVAEGTQLCFSLLYHFAFHTHTFSWMTAHHLYLNLDKSEMLLFPDKCCPLQDLSIRTDSTTGTPAQTSKDLSVILGSQLPCNACITASTSSSCMTPDPSLPTSCCKQDPCWSNELLCSQLITCTNSFKASAFSHVTSTPP